MAEAVAAAKGADLLVVASPTYKATYTGLLKLFLDQIGADDLAGVVTVPVMVGAGAGHALAVETHLRPVLVELGAAMPTQGPLPPGGRAPRPHPRARDLVGPGRGPGAPTARLTAAQPASGAGPVVARR